MSGEDEIEDEVEGEDDEDEETLSEEEQRDMMRDAIGKFLLLTTHVSQTVYESRLTTNHNFIASTI